MKSTTKLAVTTLLVVPLLQGCGDDSSKKSAKVGSNGETLSGNQTSNNSATNSSADSDSHSNSTGNYDENATFRMPTNADIAQQYGADLAFYPMAGVTENDTDCERDWAKSPATCQWKISQSGIRDGVGDVVATCDNRGTNYENFIPDYIKSDPELEEVKSLGVPAALRKSAEGTDTYASLIVVFKLDSQVALRVCELQVRPRWDETMSTPRNMDTDTAVNDTMSLAKKLIQKP